VNAANKLFKVNYTIDKEMNKKSNSINKGTIPVSKLENYLSMLSAHRQKPIYRQLQLLNYKKSISNSKKQNSVTHSTRNKSVSRSIKFTQKKDYVNDKDILIDWERSPLYVNIKNNEAVFNYYANPEVYYEFEVTYIANYIKKEPLIKSKLKELHNKALTTLNKLVEELGLEQWLNSLKLNLVEVYLYLKEY